MKCNYPNCGAVAMFLPVIELPTIRTKGVTYPPKPNPAFFKFGSHAYTVAMRVYEIALAEVKKREDELSASKKTTYMILREVCQPHKEKYCFQDWFRESEWEYVREAARSRGFDIPPINIVAIGFRPIGWAPESQYMDLQRDRMNTGGL